MSIDDVTIEPVWANKGMTYQLCKCTYGKYHFMERTYFPPIFSTRPITTFYEFWPEDGKAREFKNSTTAESAYDAGVYGIAFNNMETMVEFLDQYDKEI